MGHIYVKDGKEYPSVTTILKIIGNDSITKWANYLGFKHIDYEKELERTANYGTELHKRLQYHVDPENAFNIAEFKNPVLERDYVIAVSKFKDMISNYNYSTIFTEKEFVSDKLGYGGTLDWFCKMNDKNILVDFKTSKKVRFKHLLQLGGYYNLLIENGYEVDGGAIIIANSNVSTMYTITKEDLENLSKGFTCIYNTYLYLNEFEDKIPHSKDLNSLLKVTKE